VPPRYFQFFSTRSCWFGSDLDREKKKIMKKKKKKKNRIYASSSSIVLRSLADLFLYPCTLPTAPVSMKNCVVVRAWPPKIPKKENYQVYPARVGILNFVSIN
jgi:hypothetical protein